MSNEFCIDQTPTTEEAYARPIFQRRGRRRMFVDVESPAPKKIEIEVVAECQIFSDMLTGDWTKDTLDEAVTQKKLQSYCILHVAEGVWGLRHVIFKVRCEVDAGSQDSITNQARRIMHDIILDSDVDVRWISKL